MGVLLYLGPSKTHILLLAEHEKELCSGFNKIKQAHFGYNIVTGAGKRVFILLGPILILYLAHTGIPNYKMLRVHGQILITW